MRRSRHARPFTNTAPRQEARATASKPRAARPSPLSRTGALPGLETGRERPPPGYYKWRDRGLSYRPDRPAAQDQEHISAEQPETALRFTAGFFCSSRTQSASHGVRPLPGTPHTPPPPPRAAFRALAQSHRRMAHPSARFLGNTLHLQAQAWGSFPPQRQVFRACFVHTCTSCLYNCKNQKLATVPRARLPAHAHHKHHARESVSTRTHSALPMHAHPHRPRKGQSVSMHTPRPPRLPCPCNTRIVPARHRC